jgi:hypothetical protein
MPQRPVRLWGLSDRQLAIIFKVAEPLEPDKRARLLERLGAHFRHAGRYGLVKDDQLEAALVKALAGLQQGTADKWRPFQ